MVITCLKVPMGVLVHGSSLQLLLVQIQVTRGVGISCEKLNIMRVWMIVWIVGAVGLCQGSLGRENTTRTAYSDRNTLDWFLYCTSRSASITEISGNVYNAKIITNKMILIADNSSRTIQSNMRRQFSLHPFLITCKEAVLQLDYNERGRHSLENVQVPRVISVNEPCAELRKVMIGNEDFQNCSDTKIENTCRIRLYLRFLCRDGILLLL